MSRFINALLVFLMVLSAAAVYDMKYEAEIAAANLARIEREIAQQQAAISLLKAEWSVLTQPARLQELVERHAEILNLQPLTARQIGVLADIPEKPVLAVPSIDAPEDLVPAPAAQRSVAVDAPATTASIR